MRLVFTLIFVITAYFSSASTYCIPAPSNGVNGHSAANISLEALNSPGDSTSIYSFFPDTLITQTCYLLPGHSYTLDILSNSNHSTSTYAAWIDWNNDTTLSASEKLGEFTTTSGGQTNSISFTVPLNSLTGKLRLRVRCSSASSINSCSNYTSGQISDFTVTILNNNFEYTFFNGWDTASTGVDYINSISFGGISNQSTGHINGPVYHDFSYLSANVTCCTAEIIDIETVIPTSLLNHCDIYVDVNNNGAFTLDELLFTFNPSVGTHINSVSFTLPSISGTHRLRIYLFTNSGLTEVEEYSLNISPTANSVRPNAEIGSNLYSDCNGNCRFIGCVGLNTFQDLSCGLPTSWQWSVPGATPSQSTSQNPSFTFSPGTYIVKLVATNSLGVDSTQATIIIKPPFNNFSFGADTSLCPGDSIVLTAPQSTSNNCFLYQWSTGAIGNSIVVHNSGTYSVRLDTCSHLACPAIDTIVVEFSPQSYAVSGGGFYCSGTPAPGVGLSDSQNGVSYQLLFNGTPAGSPIPGTGNPIGFGLQSQTGTYTIHATNSSTGCSATMTGSVNVAMNPLPQRFLVVGGGSFCPGTGSHVSLNSSQANVSYQLYRNGNPIGSPVNGNGGAINFPSQPSSGTYTVIATHLNTACKDTMNGSAAIIILPAPHVYQVLGGGLFCAGSIDAAVELDNSDTGYVYILLLNSIPTGDTLIGTGSAISFTNLTQSGVYTISGLSISICSSIMNGSATLTIKPSPAVFNVTGTGTYCIGGDAVDIGVDTSQVLVNYRIWIGGFPSGGVVPGTGSALTVLSTINPGTYNIVATNTSNACTSTMHGVATIVVDSFPIVFNVTGGGTFCEGDSGVSIGLDGSVAGNEYTLFRDGDSTGVSLIGSGSALDFGTIDSGGDYIIMATNMNHCWAAMSGNAVIVENLLPVCSVSPFAEDTVCIYHSPIALSGMPPGGLLSAIGISNDTLDPSVAGAGVVVVTYDYTDSSGCFSSATDSVFIDLCIGINEQQRQKYIGIYPNPANNLIEVDFEFVQSDFTIEIFNSLGALQRRFRLDGALGKLVYPVNTSDLSDGVHLLRITLDEIVYQYRIVIAH